MKTQLSQLSIMYGISIISFSYGESVKYFVIFSLPFSENKKRACNDKLIITRSIFLKGVSTVPIYIIVYGF